MIIPGFLHNKSNKYRPVTTSGIYNKGKLVSANMRPGQKKVWDKHRNSRFFILNHPGGSGKSMLIKFVHAYDVSQNPERKLLVAMPATMIAKTFQSVELQYPKGTTPSKIIWDVRNDLCQDQKESKIPLLKKFLTENQIVKGIHERMELCTHSALNSLADLSVEELESLFHNTTLIIDEAHRCLISGFEDEDGNLLGTDFNKIGKLIDKLMKINDPTFKLWIVTATLFRGDKRSSLGEYEELFERDFMSLDEHWGENCSTIEDFDFNFVIYKSADRIKEAVEILKNQKKKTIVYVPFTNGICKYKLVEKLIQQIKIVWPEANILDLVNEKGRGDRKEIFLSEEEAKKIDVILSLRLMDEGTDWEWAEQILDLAPPQKSLRVLVQRFLRLFRPNAQKRHLHYYMFLPFVLDQLDDTKYLKSLNNHFAAFAASLIIEDIVRPYSVLVPKKKGSKGGGGSSDAGFFVAIMPDLNDRAELLAEIVQSLLKLKADQGSVPSMDKVKACIENVLYDYEIKTHIEEITKEIVGRLRNRIQPGFDIAGLGFEKIWKDEIFNMLLAFVSGACTIKTFRELKTLLRQNFFDKIEQIKKIGVFNLKKSDPLYPFISKVRREYKKTS